MALPATVVENTAKATIATDGFSKILDASSNLAAKVTRLIYDNSGTYMGFKGFPYLVLIMGMQFLNHTYKKKLTQRVSWWKWLQVFIFRRHRSVPVTTMELSLPVERKIALEISQNATPWAYTFQMKDQTTKRRFLYFKPTLQGNVLTDLHIYTDSSAWNELFSDIPAHTLDLAKDYMVNQLIPTSISQSKFEFTQEISGLYKIWFYIVHWVSKLGKAREVSENRREIPWMDKDQTRQSKMLTFPRAIMRVYREQWDHQVFVVPDMTPDSLNYEVNFVGSASKSKFDEYVDENFQKFWENPDDSSLLPPLHDESIKDMFGLKVPEYEEAKQSQFEIIQEGYPNVEEIY